MGGMFCNIVFVLVVAMFVCVCVCVCVYCRGFCLCSIFVELHRWLLWLSDVGYFWWVMFVADWCYWLVFSDVRCRFLVAVFCCCWSWLICVLIFVDYLVHDFGASFLWLVTYVRVWCLGHLCVLLIFVDDFRFIHCVWCSLGVHLWLISAPSIRGLFAWMCLEQTKTKKNKTKCYLWFWFWLV